MSNGNKKCQFVETNFMNIFVKFQLKIPEEMIFFNIFFTNLAFGYRLSIKLRGLNKNIMFGTTQGTFLWNICLNICSDNAINANFQFSL